LFIARLITSVNFSAQYMRTSSSSGYEISPNNDLLDFTTVPFSSLFHGFPGILPVGR